MYETLEKDGVGTLDVKIDMSAMLKMTEQITQGFSYESCEDPKLLEAYEVDSLSVPFTREDTQTTTITYSCETDIEGTGYEFITKTESDNSSVSTGFNVEDCYDPIFLESHGLLSNPEIEYLDFEGEFPMVKTEITTEISEVSCSESEDKITISTSTIDPETEASLGEATISYEKPKTSVDTTNDVCESDPVKAKLHPLEFVSCESEATLGISTMSYQRVNTEGFTIDGDDVIYNLNSVIQNTQEEVNDSAKNSSQNTNPGAPTNLFGNDGIDPSSMGMEVKYILESPWALADNTHGELVDDYVLEIDLFKINEPENIQVTLLGAAQDIIMNEQEPSLEIKTKVSKMLVGIYENISASNASDAKKIKYLDYVQRRFEAWGEQSESKAKIAKYAVQKIQIMKDAFQVTETETDLLEL